MSKSIPIKADNKLLTKYKISEVDDNVNQSKNNLNNSQLVKSFSGSKPNLNTSALESVQF